MPQLLSGITHLAKGEVVMVSCDNTSTTALAAQMGTILSAILAGQTASATRPKRDIFTATAGQVTFNLTFTATTYSKVYVQGALYTTGFSIVAGNIVFDPGIVQDGAEVVVDEF